MEGYDKWKIIFEDKNHKEGDDGNRDFDLWPLLSSVLQGSHLLCESLGFLEALSRDADVCRFSVVRLWTLCILLFLCTSPFFHIYADCFSRPLCLDFLVNMNRIRTEWITLRTRYQLLPEPEQNAGVNSPLSWFCTSCLFIYFSFLHIFVCISDSFVSLFPFFLVCCHLAITYFHFKYNCSCFVPLLCVCIVLICFCL